MPAWWHPTEGRPLTVEELSRHITLTPASGDAVLQHLDRDTGYDAQYNWHYVREASPIIEAIQQNAATLHIDMQQFRSVGGYYFVEPSLLHAVKLAAQRATATSV
jgi:hypothetical protein